MKCARTKPETAPAIQPEQRDVLTVDQAADYLAVARSTLYKLIQRGEVPHMKIGGSVRFSRQMLLDWVESESRKSVRRQEQAKSEDGK